MASKTQEPGKRRRKELRADVCGFFSRKAGPRTRRKVSSSAAALALSRPKATAEDDGGGGSLPRRVQGIPPFGTVLPLLRIQGKEDVLLG